jgi:hypothetical protein
MCCFRSAVLTLLIVAKIGLMGCSSKSTNGGNPVSENPGVGSQSIFADVIVNASDVSAGVFLMTFTASLRDSFNVPITDASVSLFNGTLGNMILNHDNSFPGTYRGTHNGFVSGSYGLSMRRGTDSITGAYVNVLDMHSITIPNMNDTLSMGSPFDVQWTRSQRGDTAEVETRDVATAQTADDGTYTVPNNPTARNDQRIRVRRLHNLLLTGGRSGSQIRVIVRNSLEPLVVQ